MLRRFGTVEGMTTHCSHCSAPRKIGHVICSYCRNPYDAAAAASAIPCPKCGVLSADGQQKCVGCSAWIVVSCVFCGAHSPHTKTACLSCGEIFLGAAERKAAAARAAEDDDDEDDDEDDGWEDGWAWCDKCQGLVYDEDPPGPCAAGGAHDTGDSEAYFLSPDGEACDGQSGWRWCKACQGLFHGGPRHGVCPATGGPHDGTASDDYTVTRSVDDDFDEDASGWKHCGKCAVMFWGDKGGACAAGGKHDRSDKTDYSIPYEEE